MTFISAHEPDWTRERQVKFWDPGKKLVKSIRDYEKFTTAGGALSAMRAKFAVFRHRFWSAVTSCDIQLGTQIGGGLILPHPVGIVIHASSKIGPNCLIHQNVTIGSYEGGGGSPEIGGHVDIGAGAVIVGGVKIGNHAQIGANAVVRTDVPDRMVAVGVPAKLKAQRLRKSVPPPKT